MGIMDKFKQFINVTDDDYIEGDSGYADDFDYAPSAPVAAQPVMQQPAHTSRHERASSNVVNINNAAKNASAQQPKPHVVFQKIDRFEEVGEVADILNEKRIVILNLETCPNDVSQRIIDFLYGVAYANHGESADLTHAQLRAGWALITARAGGTPLFFSRPQGPEATQFPGVSKIGDIGNNEFKHPEVVAVNKFRTAMVGQDETLINGENTGVLIVKRGDKGAVIINVNQGGKSKVSFELNLPDGTYKDKANKLKYTVKDGVVNITVPRKKIAVIY